MSISPTGAPYNPFAVLKAVESAILATGDPFALAQYEDANAWYVQGELMKLRDFLINTLDRPVLSDDS